MAELIVGVILGAVVVYLLMRGQRVSQRAVLRDEIAATCRAQAEEEKAQITQRYEAHIQALEARHRERVVQARRRGADRSRMVLKGKMAEQIAPLLPGFDYWPADARFLGDPVDYVVFDGYSRCREGVTDGEELEVVILDIKQGKSGLSQGQRRIAEAVAAGRVRFEVVRVLVDGTVRTRTWPEDSGR